MENTIQAKDWIIILLSIAILMTMTVLGINRGIKGAISWQLEAVSEKNASPKRGRAKYTKKMRTRQVPKADIETSCPEEDSDNYSVQSLPSSNSGTSSQEIATVTIHGLAPPNTPLCSEDEY